MNHEEKIPLQQSDAGGSSASGNGARPDMAAMVAAEKAKYTAVDPNGFTYDDTLFSDVIQAVAIADQNQKPRKAPPADVAPVRRKGQPPPPRADIPIREPSIPKPKKVREISDEELLAEAGIEPFYSTAEAAQFFDKTPQWIYWGLGRNGDPAVFVHQDGTPIEPPRVGNPKTGRRRFTISTIREILLSCYRRGNVDPDDLKRILRRIHISESGGEWRAKEGWHLIKGSWVPPHKCHKVHGVWMKKKEKASADES